MREHLVLAWQHGAQYADEYVDSVLAGRQVRPSPAGLHTYTSKMIREVAQDVLTAHRASIRP